MNELQNQLKFSMDGKRGTLTKQEIHTGTSTVQVGTIISGEFSVLLYEDTAMIFCIPDSGMDFIKTSRVQRIVSMDIVGNFLSIILETKTSVYVALVVLTEEEKNGSLNKETKGETK